MPTDTYKRKLAAILSADAVGYSRLMADDEVGTVQRITAYRELIGIRVQEHHGRVVDSPGDNLLAEFPSALDATRCAIEIQGALKNRNADLPTDRRMDFRIGIHLGDVLVDGVRIYGDGVNISARLESLAEVGGISISDAVYNQVKNKLQFRYEDQGEQSVKNIDEPVQVYRVVMESETIWKENDKPIKITGQQEEFKLPEGPSIAVLPFVNMSGDTSQEYICDGLTENIITNLSYNPKLFVIARNSSFYFKGKSVPVQEVAEKLSVRYVLEGSFQKTGERVRINAQLIDAKTGHHLWAQKYDRELKDLFELQDEISEKIYRALAVKLTDGDRAKTFYKGPTNLEVSLKIMKATSYFIRGNPEDNIRARVKAEQALTLSPEHSGPYITLAWTYIMDVFFNEDEPPLKSLTKASKFAKSALKIDDNNPEPYLALSILSLTEGRYEKAITLAKRAITLNPNYGQAYFNLGQILIFAGEPDKGIELIKKAIRLDPIPPSFYLMHMGNAYRILGQYKEAIAVLKKAIDREPDNFFTRTTLVSTYSLSGQYQKARSEAAEILRINPGFSLDLVAERWPYKNQDETDRIIEALRKAGLK